MPGPKVAISAEPPALAEGLRRLRDTLGVPAEFPADVLADAERAAARPLPELPDRTDIAFVTLDPASSTDLDQAFHLSRVGDGYLLRYAIADVADFVAAGSAVDVEAHQRGETLYAPNYRTPLHPPVLSEGAASLLPDQVRPALVWELELDTEGRTTATHVARALVRSRAKLDYVSAQAALDAGTADEQLELLRTVGTLLQIQEVARGGVSLNVPEQEVVTQGSVWSLAYRAPLPIEGWNAQLSLATGMAAAKLMLGAGVGLLRTLPPAKESSIERLRRTAHALGLDWHHAQAYPDFVRSLDARVPAQAAMLNSCTTLFRGAGYLVLDGTTPEQPEHAAIAAPYAHVTAPLRRLADRYAGEVCLAICAGTPVPRWVLEGLPELPGEMSESGRRTNKFERGTVDLVEALVLAPRMGQTFDGVVIALDEEDENEGVLQLTDPAVEAKVKGGRLVLGQEVQATLTAADLVTGAVQFRLL
ncbi:MAG: ribonuclease II [Actinobacteria bacterium HGW-Actinobacteria-2]|nr:MAG: ribonuclease II [Actinobacteria bacterium HGW-Actinobacteria-2]